MALYQADDGCHRAIRIAIFLQGWAPAICVPFLGRVCLESSIREGGDAGEPAVIYQPDSEQAAAFRALAQQVAAQVSVMNARRPAAPKVPIKLEMGAN